MNNIGLSFFFLDLFNKMNPVPRSKPWNPTWRVFFCRTTTFTLVSNTSYKTVPFLSLCSLSKPKPDDFAPKTGSGGILDLLTWHSSCRLSCLVAKIAHRSKFLMQTAFFFCTLARAARNMKCTTNVVAVSLGSDRAISFNSCDCTINFFKICTHLSSSSIFISQNRNTASSMRSHFSACVLKVQ